ncbi:MAG: type II toxin-antitoxin system Phd/YefM family antitoxin [Betaproteobacteria bacterium]|nr:type II toxin-antitoxin system Phd/YefM family antitoxin [Betaproteobacteria bacterium]
MEPVLATRSVSITELKRSPGAVIEQAGSEPVAVLNHNRPAAYLLPPHVYQAILERLNADLRLAIREGIASGTDVPTEEVFAELNARYAEPEQVAKPRGKQGRKPPA